MLRSVAHFAGLVLSLALMSMAQAPVPFATFIRQLKHAQAEDFLRRPASRVKNAGEFEHMRDYLLRLYRGVHVRQSYSAGTQIIDCVPQNEQPSVRDQAKDIVTPAPGAEAQNSDPAGCGIGTIPMRRITLEELTRFSTLNDYLGKAPGGERVPAPHKR